MTKLHVVRQASSGVKLLESNVHTSSTVYEPERGTYWWIDGRDYVVIDTQDADVYNTGDPKGSITVFVM